MGEKEKFEGENEAKELLSEMTVLDERYLKIENAGPEFKEERLKLLESYYRLGKELTTILNNAGINPRDFARSQEV